MFRDARMSPCQRYRYELWRRWSVGPNKMLFIGLNPSTADACEDDRTVSRLIRLAQTQDFDSLHVLNLFALRAANPSVMLAASEPIGRDNNPTLRRACNDKSASCTLVAGWGTKATHRGRSHTVLNLLKELGHPVYCWKLCRGRAAPPALP